MGLGIKRDLDLLWKLPQKRRMQFLSQFSMLFNNVTVLEDDTCIEKINENLKGDTEENLRIINLLRTFYEAWHPARDTPANFMKDMEELNLFPEKNTENAKKFMLEFLSLLEQNNPKRLKDYYVSRGMAQLAGIDYVVDFRPMIRQPFVYSTPKKVSEYNPKIEDFTPVIICNLATDEDKHLAFQTSPEVVKNFIDTLTAALKEIEAAKYTLSEKKGLKRK